MISSKINNIIYCKKHLSIFILIHLATKKSKIMRKLIYYNNVYFSV